MKVEIIFLNKFNIKNYHILNNLVHKVLHIHKTYVNLGKDLTIIKYL